MIKATVEDQGALQLLEDLADMANTVLEPAVDETLEFILQLWEYQQNRLPPKPAGSSYIRTFALRRSRERDTVEVDNDGARGAAWLSGDTAPHNIWVKSAILQADIHKGRWATDLDDTEEASLFLSNAVFKYADRLLNIQR